MTTNTTFAALKKSGKKDISKLSAEIEKMNAKSSFNKDDDDSREWKLTVDKSQNGHAVIRFLAAPKGEDLPWVRIYDHGFKGPGGTWYIENSLTTLGKKDPVSEYNSVQWNNGTEEGKQVARDQKRRLNYWCNILVVDDPANPDNNGKVFLYRFGAKIWDKINDQMNPEFEEDEAMNPFNFWEGANFKLRAAKVGGFRNYDKSVFSDPSPVADTDEAIEAIWKSQISLQDIVSPDKFKTYAELEARFNKALGLDESSINRSDAETDSPRPGATSEASSLPTAEAGSGVIADQASDSSDDDDSGLDYFRKLAEDA